MFGRSIKSALFVDGHNIIGKIPGGGFPQAHLHWVAWLKDGAFGRKQGKRQFIEKRVYITAPHHHHAETFEAAGFIVVPTAVDDVIKFDMVEALYRHPEVEEYVLLTVDQDFDHVLDRLGEHNKRRIVTFEPDTPSASLFPPRSECAFPVADLRAALHYERPPPLWWRALVGLHSKTSDLGRTVSAAVYGPYARFRRRVATRKIMRTVADRVAVLALQQPGSPVGKRTVMQHLEQYVPELESIGRFAGYATYQEMIEQIVALRPDLTLSRPTSGGAAIVARVAQKQRPALQAALSTTNPARYT